MTISCRQGQVGQVFNVNGIADSGSALDVLSFQQAKALNLTILDTDVSMVTASGDPLVSAGAAQVQFAYNDVVVSALADTRVTIRRHRRAFHARSCSSVFTFL